MRKYCRLRKLNKKIAITDKIIDELLVDLGEDELDSIIVTSENRNTIIHLISHYLNN